MAGLSQKIREAARPLRGTADHDPLLERVGAARLVLLGEATHGSEEFYRAEITKRLIADRGFAAVAVEADWPDADRVNRFVRGIGEDADSTQALGDFRRFPSWMWRNTRALRSRRTCRRRFLQRFDGRREGDNPPFSVARFTSR